MSTPVDRSEDPAQPSADPRTGAHPWFTVKQRVLLAVLGVLAIGGILVALLSTLPGLQDERNAAFGERPESPPVDCVDRSSVTISGLTFRGIDDARPAITVRNCSHVVIEDNDFIDVAEPVYVYGSRDVVIRNNRYRNITGPHERDGSHRGNFTQWDQSYGGEISGNTGIGGDTEDIISIYRSGGADAEHPLVIRNNRFEGTDWTSTSGSGILVGDGGGDHVVVRDNVLVNVGQVGIGVAGGHDIRVVDNTVYGGRRAGSNVGIYTWGQGATCSDVEVRGNRVDFTKADGTAAPFYDAGNCGTIAGVAENQFGAAIDPERLRVRL